MARSDSRALVRFRRNKGAVFGLALVSALVIFAIVFPWVSGQSPFEPDFEHGRAQFGIPTGPSRLHLLGTDTIFRDLLVRLAYGGRLSLQVAVMATAIAMVLGTGVGVLSGWFKGTRVRVDALAEVSAVGLALGALITLSFGSTAMGFRLLGAAAWVFVLGLLLRAPFSFRRSAGARAVVDLVLLVGIGWSFARFGIEAFGQHRIVAAVTVVSAISAGLGLHGDRASGHLRIDLDDAAMRVVDVLLSFPFLLLLMALSAAVDRTTQTTIFLVLGLTGWSGMARIIRGKTLQIRELEFVTAARALGQSTPRVLLRHILPNVIGVAIVLATNAVAGMIVAEAALSFLGLSVPPPMPSWGRMLDEGRPYASLAPWLLIAPAAAILCAVLGFNLLGDGLRDAFDPKDA